MEITPPFGEQEAARAAEMEHDHSDADVLASAAGHFNHGHPVLREGRRGSAGSTSAG